MLFAISVSGCGDAESGNDSTSGAGGMDDGKFRPDTNGVRITEEAACETLRTSREQKRMEYGCVMTTRACPALVRAEFGPECVEYDEGSVDGCAAFYSDAADCDALSNAIDICVVTTFDDSAPAGCP